MTFRKSGGLVYVFYCIIKSAKDLINANENGEYFADSARGTINEYF